MALTLKDVQDQSWAAYNAWRDQWDKHAVINGEIHKNSGRSYRHKDIIYNEVGKTFVCCALGQSLEKQIHILQEYANNDGVVFGCVDKAMGPLIEHGIKPKYVFLADAGVSYELYCKPWIEHTADMYLVANVVANAEWTQNWKGKYIFYVNKDAIYTEEIYTKMSGVMDVVPAASNVGNNTVVFSSQLFGADKYLLVGYDFCWFNDSNYYAFSDNKKRYWMSHSLSHDMNGNLCFSSQNLMFSAKWLTDFYTNLLGPSGKRIFNCSESGILVFPRSKLKKQLASSKKRKLEDKEKNKIASARFDHITATNMDELNDIMRNYNIGNITVNTLTKDSREFMEGL